MSFFHTYPNDSTLDNPIEIECVQPQFHISFTTSYTSIQHDDVDGDYHDDSIYECIAHFNSLDDAIQWADHFCGVTTMIDDKSLVGGIHYSMNFIGDTNGFMLMTTPSWTEYPCDYDHSYWSNLIVGEIDEFCKQ